MAFRKCYLNRVSSQGVSRITREGDIVICERVNPPVVSRSVDDLSEGNSPAQHPGSRLPHAGSNGHSRPQGGGLQINGQRDNRRI